MKRFLKTNKVLLFLFAVSVLYSLFVSMSTNIDTILNGVSFSSSVVTIVVTALNLWTLWCVENYKKDMYKKADCKRATEVLEKIKKSIKDELINTGKCRNNLLPEILSNINALLDENLPLQQSCKRHLAMIQKIKKIDTKSKEMLFRAIDSIVMLYKKGE